MLYHLTTSDDDLLALQQLACQLGHEFAAVRDAAGAQPSGHERPTDAAAFVWLLHSQERGGDALVAVDDAVLGRALFIEGFIAGSQASDRANTTRPTTIGPLVCPQCSSLSPHAEHGVCGVLCEAGWVVLRFRTVSDALAADSLRRRADPAAERRSDG